MRRGFVGILISVLLEGNCTDFWCMRLIDFDGYLQSIQNGVAVEDDGHDGDRLAGIRQQACEHHHDFVAPPLQASHETGGQCEPEQRPPLVEASFRPARPRVLAHTGVFDVNQEEDDHVDVGPEVGNSCARGAQAAPED